MSASFRAIIPASQGAKRGSQEEPIDNQPKKKRGPPACESCRARKVKCSAERPACRTCAERQAVCRYTDSEARSARAKYKEMKQHRSALEELLELIRTLPEQEAADVFRRIRAGAEDSLAILNHVKAGDLLLQIRLEPESRLRYELPYSRNIPEVLLKSGSPYLDSVIYKEASQHAIRSELDSHSDEGANTALRPASTQFIDQYIKPYHAAVLVEPLLEKARPSDWTNVSKDDALMRDLLSTFLTHEYHLFPVFKKDCFLEDMADTQVSKRATEFCSLLLVNAILAHAWNTSSKGPNCFMYWEPESLGYRFLAEAKRLWELEVHGGSHSLASVHAAMIINAVYCFCALDKLGHIYGLQGLAMAQDLRLFEGNGHINTKRSRDARNYTAWALFNMDSLFAWHYSSRPILERPPRFTLPDPLSDAAWYGELRTKYPLGQGLSPTNYGHVLKAISDYRVILSDLCRANVDSGMDLPAQEAKVLGSRLSSWHRNLPQVLSPKYIVLPAHLFVHIEYHAAMISLYQPFIHKQWDINPTPRDIVANSERDLNILMRLYCLRHGFSHADAYLVSPLSKLGLMALQTIKTHQPEEGQLDYARSTLFLALQGLREQGRSYYITRAMYYILRNQLRPEEARFLAGVENVECAADESPGMAGEIQSAWTPAILNTSDSRTAEELSQLASEFLRIGSRETSEVRAADGSSA